MTPLFSLRPVAVYDANVLYPSLIHNLLMDLETEGLGLKDRPDLTTERWRARGTIW